MGDQAHMGPSVRDPPVSPSGRPGSGNWASPADPLLQHLVTNVAHLVPVNGLEVRVVSTHSAKV